jgi:hypothetical protein
MTTDMHQIDQVTIVRRNGQTFLYDGIPKLGNLIASNDSSGLGGIDPWGNRLFVGQWIGPQAYHWLAVYGLKVLIRD